MGSAQRYRAVVSPRKPLRRITLSCPCSIAIAMRFRAKQLPATTDS